MQVETVVSNCKVVRHNEILDVGVAIDQGKIVALARDDDLPQAGKVIDGQGKYLIPGLVDAHVHLQYPPGVEPESNIRRETRTCAAAGCTTIVHLLAPADDIVTNAKDFIALYEKNAFVDLALSARIYTVENIKQIESIYDFGIVAFKLLLPYKGSEAVWKGRTGGIDDGIIYLTFREIGRLAQNGGNAFARVHCENVEIFLKLKEEYLQKGIVPSSWNAVRGRVCEEEAMRKCLFLAGLTGCPLYVVHMTIKEGVNLVAEARAKEANVVTETCIQYLTRNTDDVDRILSKVNPPIREAEDNQKLWEAVKNGSIDVVATDHAPVTRALKKNFWDALPGIPSADLLLPLMLSEGVNKSRISLEKLVEVCCFNPAKKFGLLPRKGTISIGADADLVLVDLDKTVTAPDQPIYSGSDFSIFQGMEIKGWPVLTMLRGRVVAKDGVVVEKAGNGRYMTAK